MADDHAPSYLREMLLSQGNVYALLGSLAAGALLSIPFGFGIGAIPLIGFAAGEAIAAMYIPASPSFRERVDRRYRNAARQAARAHLIEEIERRAMRRGEFEQTLSVYERMTERLDSLYRLAADGRTQLSARDVEKLEDATLEYLCVRLALLVIEQRAGSIDLEDVQRRIDAIDRDLASPRPGTDVRSLQKARADYLALAARHRRMTSRKTALEAAVLSMPDQMEEIYQAIVTAPTAEGLGARLDEAVANLRLQEDIEGELEEDLAQELPGLVVPIARATGGARRKAAAATQRQA